MEPLRPLPWDWFDFAETPRDPPAGGLPAIDSVEDGGGTRVWRLRVGRRTLLARILRRAAPARAQRQPLVLLHGMGLTVATFWGVAPYLLETHDLVMLDYSGLACAPAGMPARDAGWSGPIDVRALVAGVFGAMNALKIPRADFAGNSLGGGMCLVAALEQPPRVGRIVLANPACYPQTLPRMYRWVRIPLLGEILMTLTRPEKLIGGVEYIGYVDKTRFHASLRSRYVQNMSVRTNRLRLMQLIRSLPGHPRDAAVAIHVPRLGEIESPVMISWGQQDPLLVADAGERLARDLKHAAFINYPDLAHMPHEEAPERIGPAWADFLNRDAHH